MISVFQNVPLANIQQSLPLTTVDAEAAASKAAEMRKNLGMQFEAIKEQMVMLHDEVISIKTDGLEVQGKQISEIQEARQSQQANVDDLMSKVDFITSRLDSLTATVGHLTSAIHALTSDT